MFYHVNIVEICIEFMKEIPIEYFLKSRKDLTFWLYTYNKVNNKLGLPDCNILL